MQNPHSQHTHRTSVLRALSGSAMICLTLAFSGLANSSEALRNGSDDLKHLENGGVSAVLVENVSLAERGASTLQLRRVNPFSSSSAILTGDDQGGLQSQPLRKRSYYRGSIEGQKSSFVLLEVSPDGEISGTVVNDDQVWQLSKDASSKAIVTSKLPSAAGTGITHFGDDIVRPPTTLVDLQKGTISGRPSQQLQAITEYDYGDLNINDTRGFNMSAGTAVVFRAVVPDRAESATFRVQNQSGNADLLVRRESDQAVVCESNLTSGDDVCVITTPGTYEVLMIAVTNAAAFLSYSAVAGELPQGGLYEIDVAIDIDYALYSDLGSIEALQTYLATLFSYNNTMFEREMRTRMVVGQIRARTTSEDDPYYVSESLGSSCRLEEFSRKWHEDPLLSAVDRSLVAHLTNISFGGVATLGTLCQSSFQFQPQTIANCPFEYKTYGGFSVTGVSANSATVGSSIQQDNHFTSHELGHNLNSRHTHCYAGVAGVSESVDACYNGESSCWSGPESLPGLNSLTGGAQGQGTGTIMSYCHLQGGGNISDTFGLNHSYGVSPERVPNLMKEFVGATDLGTSACINVVYIDTDGDGFTDDIDVFPNDPDEWLDTDEDGVGDNADAFPEDATETVDSDGDGVGDNSDQFPDDATETVDSDGDGIGDNADAFPSDPTETVDSDSDGVGDNSDPFPNDAAESVDTDGDGIGNNADTDDDGDGVTDDDDAFPLDASETLDTDNDGIGNNADNDDDGDGYSDSEEIEAQTSPLDATDTPLDTSNLILTIVASGVLDKAAKSAIDITISGEGTVSSTRGGDCAASCTIEVPKGATVTLSATASAGYTFSEWGGACTGSSSSCSLTVSTDVSISANFTN